MTLDEAIKHCYEKSKGCSKCANEHKQLLEWLKELKYFREGIKMKTYKPNYKFRGKDENNGNYVYGNLIKFPNRSFIIKSITWDEFHCNNDINKCIFAVGSSTRNIYNSPLAIYGVEKNSVAQLIGYDKNFNEIYENDYLIDITDNQRIIIATEALKEYKFCDIFGTYILKE